MAHVVLVYLVTKCGKLVLKFYDYRVLIAQFIMNMSLAVFSGLSMYDCYAQKLLTLDRFLTGLKLSLQNVGLLVFV